MHDETARLTALIEAQATAKALFRDIEAAGLVRPGISESMLDEAIYALAERRGIAKVGRRRLARAGTNTLMSDDAGNLVLQEDDLVFIDLGPILENWEADFARTFVLGDDPLKHKLIADLAAIFEAGKSYFQANPDVSVGELFDYVHGRSKAAGWTFGGTIWALGGAIKAAGNALAGHIVADLPLISLPDETVLYYVRPKQGARLRDRDENGRLNHWVLEVHLIEPNRRFGGLYEQSLMVG